MEYLYLFMMFSIVGWLWETPFVSIKSKKYTNRGFLFGPYIPIYGFAVVSIVLSMGIFATSYSNNFLIILLQIILMGLLTATWEYFTSWGLEKVFHTRWWDYSSHKHNLQGRISLWVTIGFGIGSYLLWRLVLPAFQKLYSLIPNHYMLIILTGFFVLFTIDACITLRDLFKLKKIAQKLEIVKNNLAISLGEKINYTKDHVDIKSNRIENGLNNLRLNIKAFNEVSVSLKVRKQVDEFRELLSLYKPQRFIRKFPNSSNKAINNLRISMNKLLIKIKKNSIK